MRIKSTDLIVLNGEEPVFRESYDTPFTDIDNKFFINKLRSFQAGENFRFTWDKINEVDNKFLEKIISTKDFKKLFQQVLKVVKDELEMDKNKVQRKATFEEKIKQTPSLKLKR